MSLSSSSEAGRHDERLQEAIVAYLDSVAIGQSLDRETFLIEHPDLTDDLRAFFADHDHMNQAAAPVRVALDDEPRPVSAPTETFPQPFGDYELLEEIGRGGMGIVYRARQISLNRIVALKRIRAGQLASPEEVARFRLEAEAAAGLDHPHIVPIHEVGEHQGQHYFTMKLIEGGNLGSRLDQYGNANTCAALMIEIALAVHHAHQRGILHRDLKPSNILIDAEGQPHVGDFGLAQPLEREAKLTQSGAIVGTPEYMAPEQARGEKGLTIAADVYGLGSILYVMLAGRPPFQGDYNWETLKKVVEEDPPSPRALNPRVKRDLDTICLKCLSKAASKRYGSAAALAEDLQRWLDGKPIDARRATTGERLWKWARRKPAAAALLVVSVFAALLVFGGGSVLMLRLRDSLDERTRQGEALAGKNKALDDLVIILKDRETTLKDRTVALSSALDESRRHLFTSQLMRVDALYKTDPKQALDLLYDNEACPLGGHDSAWRFLEGSCRRMLEFTSVGRIVLRPHNDSVPTADGKLCAVVELKESGKDEVMDLVSGRIQGEVKGQIEGELTSDGATAWRFKPELSSELPPSGDTHLLLQDIATGQTREVKINLIGRSRGSPPFKVLMSPDGVTLIDRSRTGIWLFATSTGKELANVLCSAENYNYLTAFSPDGQLVAIAGQLQGHGNGVLLLETGTGKVVRFISHKTKIGLGKLLFSHNGKTLALVHSLVSIDRGGGINKQRSGAPTELDHVSVRVDGGSEVCLFDIRGERIRTFVEGTSFSATFGNKFAFSRDDRCVAALIGQDLLVWDVEQGKQIRVFPHEFWKTRWSSFRFSHDGSRLVLNGWDMLVYDLWGSGSRVFPGPTQQYGAWLTSENKLLADSELGLHTWNLNVPGHIKSFEAPGNGSAQNGGRGLDEKWHSTDDNGVYWSPNDRYLALRARDEIRVFEVLTGKERLRLTNTDYMPLFLPDGKRLACERSPEKDPWEPKPELWDLETGQQVHWPQDSKPMDFYGRVVREFSSGGDDDSANPTWHQTLRLIKEGKFQANVGDEFVRIVATNSDRVLATFPNAGKYRDSQVLAVSPDMQSLVVTRDAGTLQQLIDLPTGRPRITLSSDLQRVVGARFSWDGTLLATWDQDRTVRVWDLRPPLEFARFKGMSTTFSPDSSRAMVIDDPLNGTDSRVSLMDLTTGQILATAKDTKDFFANLERFSARPSIPLIQTRVDSRGLLCTNLVLFRPDGTTKVHLRSKIIADKDSRVRAFIEIADVSDDRVIASLPVDHDFVGYWIRNRDCFPPLLSPDGEWLVCRRDEKTVQVIRLTVGGSTITIKLDKVSRRHQYIKYSPDSKILAMESFMGLQFLDPATGKHLRHFATGKVVTEMAFSADGKTLATGHEGEVRLWDVASGERRMTLPWKPGEVRSLTFSPDGRFLSAGYKGDKTEVILWDLPQCRARLGKVHPSQQVPGQPARP